jgi:hypothetical protein
VRGGSLPPFSNRNRVAIVRRAIVWREQERMASERLLAAKLTNRRKESESGRNSDRLMWAKLYGKSRVELSRSVTGRSPVRPTPPGGC